jgi:hypothetical protein
MSRPGFRDDVLLDLKVGERQGGEGGAGPRMMPWKLYWVVAGALELVLKVQGT